MTRTDLAARFRQAGLTGKAAKEAADFTIRVVPEVESIPAPKAEPAPTPVAEPAPRVVVMRDPDSAATGKQRGFIAGLTGTYPTEKAGFGPITKAEASAAIDALKRGETVTIGGKTLRPKAA